ncbi:MAG: hypothetical protein HYY11_10025 [Candidatus Methylomirabilis oxyfera]|nr:hypothetical protein [Candidatus Methylomirabilis oxyfera]
MPNRWSTTHYLLIALLLVPLTACDLIITTTPIKNILENPRQFSGKELQIKGQVVDIFSLIVVKYFVIQDKTGEITVVTHRPLPKKGETIKVKGKVEEAFSIADQQLIVLVEVET